MTSLKNYPQKTFELRIQLNPGRSSVDALKDEVVAFLQRHGINSFVEGTIDDVDIDNEPGGPQRDFYGELGGNSQPLSVFKYSREALDDLRAHMDKEFSDRIVTTMHSMETETWMEGWKESFRPITTRLFYVYPPWDENPIPKEYIPIKIEPGMAFGTGQHATTQLCLRGLEDLVAEQKDMLVKGRVLDVGTGTGILAIAAEKLGCRSVRGTDVDPDALIAGEANAKANGCQYIAFSKASVPSGAKAEVVIANILTWVLKELMADLTGAVMPGGALLLSGLLNEDEKSLVELAESMGMQLAQTHRQDGWGCLVLRKNT